MTEWPLLNCTHITCNFSLFFLWYIRQIIQYFSINLSSLSSLQTKEVKIACVLGFQFCCGFSQFRFWFVSSKNVWGERSKWEKERKQTLNLLVKCLFCSFCWRKKKKDKQQSYYSLAWVQSLGYIYAFNSAWESRFKEIQLLHALVLASWEVHLYYSIFLDYLQCILKAFKSSEDRSERILFAILFFCWLRSQKNSANSSQAALWKTEPSKEIENDP